MNPHCDQGGLIISIRNSVPPISHALSQLEGRAESGLRGHSISLLQFSGGFLCKGDSVYKLCLQSLNAGFP